MQDQHLLSPEARRRDLAALRAKFGAEVADAARQRTRRPWDIVKRLFVGLYDDGFIHAGNLAYLALVALFPFIIVAAALAHLLGQKGEIDLAVGAFLARLPTEARSVLLGPLQEVLKARAGILLWAGALVGLWTAASLVETIRDILRRAYGIKACASFWRYRLGSIALILGAVIVLMAAFGLTVFLTTIQRYVNDALPGSDALASTLGLYRVVQGVTMFATIYALFLALTPARYRKLGCRKWPGALLVTGWWILSATALPWTIEQFGGYSRTYGSLAGVMVTLFFFFLIGLGVVTGAELNAALADAGDMALKGEHYDGPFSDQLDVAEPGPDERVPQQRKFQ